MTINVRYERGSGGTLVLEPQQRAQLEALLATQRAGLSARDLEAQRATVSSLTAAISAHDKRLARIESTYTSNLHQERLQMVARLNNLNQQASKLTFQGGLLELRAPQAGVVKEFATTTVGAVVEPGSVLVSRE